jgi:hypothetical protein
VGSFGTETFRVDCTFTQKKSNGFGRVWTRELGNQRPACEPLDHRSLLTLYCCVCLTRFILYILWTLRDGRHQIQINRSLLCEDQVRPSVRLSVSMIQYQRLNSLSNFHGILYRNSLQNAVEKSPIYTKMGPVTAIFCWKSYIVLYPQFAHKRADMDAIPCTGFPH